MAVAVWTKRPVTRRATLGDAIVGIALAGILYLLLRVAHSGPGTYSANPQIDLNPAALPLYTAYSLGRMIAAYLLSVAFTLVYGYIAAHSKRAERVMLPLLDVLQSIPMLSFMPTVVLALIALFPNSRWGIELASVILIFTSQVWNMTFGFYHSLCTLPTELKEAARSFQLGAWHRFRYLELPFAMVGLVWNSIMSWAGGWFFLMAAEMFTLGNKDFRLPGLGSYLQTAANVGDMGAVAWGLAVMVSAIVIIDTVLWRPAVAWADRFKTELTESGTPPRSAVLTLLRRSFLVEVFSEKVLAPADEAVDRFLAAVTAAGARAGAKIGRTRLSLIRGLLLAAGKLLVIAALVWGVWNGVLLLAKMPRSDLALLIPAAAATFLRVAVATLLATAWTLPVGVAIGMNRKVGAIAQPIVQIVASIPATALFPVILVLLAGVPGGLNVGSILLMMFGTQWYILFNVIAGAMSIPEDLKEATALMGLRGLARWRVLIMPVVMPRLLTGLVAAVGGAWNASIVSEYVKFRGQTLSTTGLGSLIARATNSGDFGLLLAATILLASIVVLFNRFVWRPLTVAAEKRFTL